MKRMLTLNRRLANSPELYVDIDRIDAFEDEGPNGCVIYIQGHRLAVREPASTVWGLLDLESVQFISAKP